MNNDSFIPRKFKNIETNEIVDFEAVVKSSDISVILGEPASGKTYQLKEYEKNSDSNYFIELINIEDEDEVEVEDIYCILLDSIDEALTDYKSPKKLQSKLSKFIKKAKKVNPNIKFVITCRYLEWKKYFEKKLKELNKSLNVYEIVALSNKEINNLLKEEDREDFWNFINSNHLESLLKNIMIIFHLVQKFRDYNNNSNYVDIYEKIVKEYITKIGEYREEDDTDRDLNELVLIASSLATYMMLNSISSISSSKKTASECYQIDGKSIVADDLTAVLKTALFEKKGEEFNFFHKSIQEYLTAYFINYKKLNTKIIKKIFVHDLRFYEEFEEVIIYLTNIQPTLFDDFVDFDPFIFRRHPSLNKEQQEKLLLSIIDKLQNSESYAWDRVNFFYGTSLIKFDKIDVYSLIKDKHIEKNPSDILLQYTMRVFAENYSKKFEKCVFKYFDNIKDDKIKCRNFIQYSYNYNYEYNTKLFNFMKQNTLLQVADDPNNFMAGSLDGDKNNPIVENMFLVLYGCKFNNYNKVIKIEKSNFDFKKLIYLLNYIKLEKFQEFTYRYMNIDNDILKWRKYILKNYESIEQDNSTLKNNIGWLFFILFSKFDISIIFLEKIIHFATKYDIFPKKTNYHNLSLLFTSISKEFWELYFNNKISIGEVTTFVRNYTINISDIQSIVDSYPIEDNFTKVLDLMNNLSLNNNKSIEKLYVPLNIRQEEKVLTYIKEKNINDEYIIKLFRYHYFKKLENLIFEILTKFTEDAEVCRKEIEKTLVSNYDYNIRLLKFMEENQLFRKEKTPLISIDDKNEIENWLFDGLYSLWFQNGKPICNKNNNLEKNILFLFKYISYYHFFDISKYIDIEDIEKWFNYFYRNYDNKLIEDNRDYKEILGWIAYKLLIDNNVQNIPLEKIMKFLQGTNININFTPSKNGFMSNLEDNSPKPLFYIIKNKFWDIYFSDKIKSFNGIKNFISLYHISEDDINVVIEKYPIENYIEKYYGLGVQYNFVDTLINNKEYMKYIESKQKEKDSLDYAEKKYLDNINQRKEDEEYKIYIQNYKDINRFNIFNYALNQNNNKFKETDKQLREDLQQNYKIFINSISKDYFLLKKEYYDNGNPNNQWIYNYLFNVLGTKEDIAKAVDSKENYKKLFWYIILGCISTDNKELFKVIEDKFDLFIETILELDKYIDKKNNHCYLSWEHNTYTSPCRRVIDILDSIDFDKTSDIWINFIKYFEEVKEKNPQYDDFYKKITEMNPKPLNNQGSFNHFNLILKKDINKALEYFYKYIYDSISLKIKYSIEEKNKILYNTNHLYSKYLVGFISSFKYKYSPDSRPSFIDKRTEEEKKDDDKKELTKKIKDFYKNKNTSYNIIKIILFDKLLDTLERSNEYKKLNEIYIEKILVDYYRLFNEEKIPLAKDYSKYFGDNRLIINIWGILQNDIKYENLLKTLQQSENRYISDSATYCLLKIYKKQGEEKSFGNEYYKNILDEGILPIKSSNDFFKDINQKIEKLKIEIEDNRNNDISSFYRDKKLTEQKTEDECRDIILQRLNDKYQNEILCVKEQNEANNRVDINIKYKNNLNLEVQIESKRDDNKDIYKGIKNQLIDKYFSSNVQYGIYLIFYFANKKDKTVLLEKVNKSIPKEYVDNIKVVCIDLTQGNKDDN
jgi:hypothetical protein